MNTLKDLKDTLGQHADSVHDASAVARTAAVRGRARAVRRQRAVGVVAAAVLAVGGASALSLLPGNQQDAPQPAERPRVDGHRAPASIESFGSTYVFDEANTGRDSLTLDLAASDEPRLVSWAGESPLTVNSSSADGDRTGVPGDFSEWTLVYPGTPQSITVDGRGELAIAVYDLQDRAPGDYVDGIAFPDVVDGEHRVGSAIGDAGRTDLSFEVTMPEHDLSLREVCRTEARGLEAHVSINGEHFTSGDCGPQRLTGLVSGGGAATPERTSLPSAGQSVTLRIWVTPRTNGSKPPQKALDSAEVSDLRLGLGAYAGAAPVAQVPGWGVPPTYSYDGHVWEYVEHTTRDGGFSLRPAVKAPYLLVLFVGPEPRGLPRGREHLVTTEWDGAEGTNVGYDSSSMVAVAYGPDRHRLRLSAPVGSPLSVGVYRRVG